MKRGRPPYPDVLTPRQWEVLELVREGRSNPEIGRELGISPDGAKFHVSEILTKLGVTSRDEAAQWDGEPAREPSGQPAPKASLFALSAPPDTTAHGAAHAHRAPRRRYARVDAMPRIIAGAPEWREKAA